MAYNKSGFYRIKSVKSYKTINGMIFFDMEKSSNEKVLNFFKENSDLLVEIINDEIPSYSGVYLFFLKDKKRQLINTAYIGSTCNLSRRFYTHDTLCFLKNAISKKLELSVFVIKSSSYKSLEDKLIEKLNPFLNSQYRTHFQNKNITYTISKKYY